MRKQNVVILSQAFINTASKIHKKIEDGIFDVSNEVSTAEDFYFRIYLLMLRLHCFLSFCFLRLMELKLGLEWGILEQEGNLFLELHKKAPAAVEKLEVPWRKNSFC